MKKKTNQSGNSVNIKYENVIFTKKNIYIYIYINKEKEIKRKIKLKIKTKKYYYNIFPINLKW